MPSLRTNTALFLLLTLAPAGILAWLGLQASAPFLDQLRFDARTQLRRELSSIVSQVCEAMIEDERVATTRLAEAASRLREALPFGSDLGMLTTLDQEMSDLGALRLVAADGRALWPREHDSDLRHLPEWERFVQVRTAVDRGGRGAAAFEAARSLEAPALRVLATCLVLHHEPERAAVLLAPEPWHAIAEAGPLPCELLARSVDGRLQLESAQKAGGLHVVAATEHGRAEWLRVARADWATMMRQGLRVRAESGGYLRRKRVSVAGGAVLELLCQTDSAVARAQATPLLPHDCEVEFAPTDGVISGDIQFTPPATAYVHAPTILGGVEFTARDRRLLELEDRAARQHWLTSLGIGLLLLVMLTGTALVRRALLHEQRARTLRLEFLANVSHELKTPLTSLRLHAELLADPAVDGPLRARYGAVAEAEGARLSALVDDLLDFAALERGRRRIEPEPVDLARAVRDLAAAWLPLASRDGVELRAVIAPGEVPALADPTALSRILMNLLQNAARYGRPSRDGGPDWIELRTGPGPWVEVRDSGPGVAAADRDRLFQRFERLHQGRGLGLGLALSRELAEACGGRLFLVDDALATIFRLELPPVPDLPPELQPGQP
ncbi:MAG TPA: HAMP domain-containing sensor histidine kinase [Planctomycetota bacterium]